MSGAHVRRRPRRSRDEMRDAIEARVRAQDRLDAATERELAAALAARSRRSVRAVVASALGHLTYQRGTR